jgi:hypothetical protein
VTGPRQLVLVTGPPRSGVTSLVAALRERMPEVALVEAADLGSGDVPTAVVVVVSGVAPMTESDCRQVDVVTVRCAFVVGVVSKIDAHRGWRDVLAASALRYRAMPWLAVAAAPDVGPPRLDGLVEHLRDTSRKPLPVGDIRVGRLRAGRAALLRDRRRARSARALTLRGGLHQARAAMGRFVRQRCVTMRTDFRARAAELRRGDVARFEADLLDEAKTMLGELEQQLLARSDELAVMLDLAAPPRPRQGAAPQLPAPPTAPRQERRLTMVLGSGFGLGVAMAVSRLLGGLDQGMAVAALVVGATAGVGLTVWLVMTRALLQERALLDRWVGEVAATLRWHGEELVASRLLAVELGFAAALAVRDEAESADLSERVGAIDAELAPGSGHTGGSRPNFGASESVL